MRSAPRPLAIVLATSAVSLSLFCLTGCEGDEASRADKRVNQQIRTAYTTDKPIDALKAAADEDKASGASRARAKAMLADAEVLAATNQMRQIEQNQNRIASLVWELGQLGQQIQTSSRLIDAYRSYDPSVVQNAAKQHVAEVKGDKLTLDLRGQKVALPALAAVQQNITQLQDAINKQKGELEQLTAQRGQLLQQADQAAQQSENAKGREAVDAYAKASGLRKDAALLSNKIDLANSTLARLNTDLATQQGQQQILSKLATDYTSQANATEKGFKEVASQEEAQRRLIQSIYGTAPAAAKSDAAPASTPGTILSRASQLAAAVNDNDQLRASALTNLNNAVQHYGEAQQAAEDLRRKIDEKMGSANSEAPERLAWEDMKKLINPSAYQLQKSSALQTLGSLYANQAESLASRVRLANDLSKTLQAAGLKLPADLEVKDAANQVKEVRENASKAFADAADLQSTVVEAPLATESQKSAARVAKILTAYSWSNALAEAGNAAEAKKHRAEAVDMVKGAIADNVTLPALPPDILPAPKITTPPATAPASAPAKATAAANQGTPADAATVESVKQALTTVLEGAVQGDVDAIKNFIIAAPEQQPVVDTMASFVVGASKLQSAVTAKFGEEGKKAMSQAGMAMDAPDPATIKVTLDKLKITSAGPDGVVLTSPGQKEAIPLKKVGDQWKLDLAALAKSNPQVGAMLPMVATMFKPMADGINQVAADVEAGKYANVAEVQAALKKTMPNMGGFPGGAAPKTVAQDGAAPAATPTPAQ